MVPLDRVRFVPAAHRQSDERIVQALAVLQTMTAKAPVLRTFNAYYSTPALEGVRLFA